MRISAIMYMCTVHIRQLSLFRGCRPRGSMQALPKLIIPYFIVASSVVTNAGLVIETSDIMSKMSAGSRPGHAFDDLGSQIGTRGPSKGILIKS